MHTWIESSQAVVAGTFLFGMAILLFLVLDALVLSIRSWWSARRAQSPEEQAVNDVARYQGTFGFHEPGVVRRRFARRYRLRGFDNHWVCVGKWESHD